MKVKNKEGEWI